MSASGNIFSHEVKQIAISFHSEHSICQLVDATDCEIHFRFLLNGTHDVFCKISAQVSLNNKYISIFESIFTQYYICQKLHYFCNVMMHETTKIKLAYCILDIGRHVLH